MLIAMLMYFPVTAAEGLNGIWIGLITVKGLGEQQTEEAFDIFYEEDGTLAFVSFILCDQGVPVWLRKTAQNRFELINAQTCSTSLFGIDIQLDILGMQLMVQGNDLASATMSCTASLLGGSYPVDVEWSAHRLGASSIVSGVPITNLSDQNDGAKVFSITVPPGAMRLSVTTERGSGDLDLLMAAGDPPFAEPAYSAGDTTSERIDILSPIPGTWYIGVAAFPEYSGVTLTASIESGDPTVYYRDMEEAYVAYYGRPADPIGRQWWAEGLMRIGGDLSAIIQAFGTSAEFQDFYGGLSNADLVDMVYWQLLGRAPDPGGRDYYIGQLDSGAITLQTVTLDVLYGAQNEDVITIENKVVCAMYFTDQVQERGLFYTSEQIPDAREMLGLITADAPNVEPCLQAADSLLATMTP